MTYGFFQLKKVKGILQQLAGEFRENPILKFVLSETNNEISLFTGKPRAVSWDLHFRRPLN